MVRDFLREKFTGTGGTWQWNDYLFAGGAMVGVHFEFSTGTKENRYFHQDLWARSQH